MYYKFCFFVPATHVETVKSAVFKAGAGKIGNYDACCWQTRGMGQFRPLQNSQPHIGKIHHIEKIEEYKVEMVCDSHLMSTILTAFKKAHPYETPAFDILPLVDEVSL